uniref:Uncharacterized protein n=1 Tax=Coccolithus braarudii TaxID=221442 RepID=A0A7S0LCZ2_9EUKA
MASAFDEVWLVWEFAAGLVLCCIAALRVRDAQRASVRSEDGRISGMCYTSKHPKRRAALPMPFYAVGWSEHGQWYAPLDPTGLGRQVFDTGRDYVFMGYSRGRKSALRGAERLQRPVRSAEVIAVLRWLLTLPPLSMTAREAATFSVA